MTTDSTWQPDGEEPVSAERPPPFRSRGPSAGAVLFAVTLFLLTCVSTFRCGAEQVAGATPLTPWPEYLLSGLSYAIPVMAILLCHEMGHYLQAVRYGVPATLPFFIPMPISLFGTMGAVIVQAAGQANRKALFDIAISGPIAGLVIAIPVAWAGIQQSTVAQFDPAGNHMIFGDPLILKAMVWLKHGPLQPNQDVILNPLLYAGWVGVFLTGLNLLPIGQLDGGHILYTLIGRRAHIVALILIAAAGAYSVLTQSIAFIPLLLLLTLLGLRHPPTADDRVALGPGRVVLGWLMLAFIVVGLTPQPVTIKGPDNAPPPQRKLPEPREDEILVQRHQHAVGSIGMPWAVQVAGNLCYPRR